MTSAFPTSSPYANRSSKYTPIEKKFQSPQLALSYLWYYRGSCFSVVHTAADRQSIPHPSDPSFVPELPLCLWHRQNDFAPRPRTRGDACAAPPSAPISIHAPAQGATAKPAYILTYTLLFLHKLHLSLVFFFSASFKFMQKQASASVRIRLCFHERLYLAHHTISTSSG